MLLTKFTEFQFFAEEEDEPDEQMIDYNSLKAHGRGEEETRRIQR